MTVIFIYP